MLSSKRSKALSHCKWEPLYQNSQGQYATGDAGHGDAVIDKIPVGDDSDAYVHHFNVQMKSDGKLTAKTRHQLRAKGVTRHRLGHTFP